MADQFFITVQAGTSTSEAAPTSQELNHIYFAFRGSFELTGTAGRAFYFWKDGVFHEDTLVFTNNPVVPCGPHNLLGYSYRAAGPNPFFMFFGDEIIGKTDPDIDFFALMFSTDNKTFFPWPLHNGLSLRHEIAPTLGPTTGGGTSSVGSDPKKLEISLGRHKFPNDPRICPTLNPLKNHGVDTRDHFVKVWLEVSHPDIDQLKDDIRDCAVKSGVAALITGAVVAAEGGGAAGFAAAEAIFMPAFETCVQTKLGMAASQLSPKIDYKNEFGAYSGH